MRTSEFELVPGTAPKAKRIAKDPTPRFKEDRSRQLDPILGCPELVVEREHLARVVRDLVEELDLSAFEAKYSALGQRGFAPKYQLAVWVYASLIGVHSSLKLGRQLKTDAALQLLSGGRVISSGTLRRFRNQNAEMFAACISQCVSMAMERGLLPLEEGAVDSVRLRAHASLGATRTAKRSKDRLAQLKARDTSGCSDDELRRHSAVIEKHEAALKACSDANRTNVILTNPSAGLLKFPYGASAPGHRVTMTAFGTTERIVTSIIIDADSSDQGKLGPSVEQTLRDLERAGIACELVSIAADAGYSTEADLRYASEHRESIDLLVAQPLHRRHKPKSGLALFTKDDFNCSESGVICPAGTPMQGPESDGRDRIRFHGVGCNECSLRAQCTTSTRRVVVIRPQLEHARQQMNDRLAQPGARERYNQRIATIEPVFAYIEHVMNYRRVGSRHAEGARAEILLKVLAYNLSRLAAAKRRLFVLTLEIVF